jgi:VanZ family protein
VKIQINSFWPAIAGLIIATLLFCLPGKEFPDTGWLDQIHFDKVVHIGLFSMLIVLWCLPFRSRIGDKQKLSRIYLLVVLAYIVYGIAIEFIQRDFISNRSFDLFDIVADTIGCILGWVIVQKNILLKEV